MNFKFLFTIVLSFLIFSCQKDHEASLDSKHKIRIIPGPDGYRSNTAELIISEQSGKKLLDTIIAVSQQYSFDLKTSESKLVVTTLVRSSFGISIDSYFLVNSNNWDIVVPNRNFVTYYYQGLKTYSPVNGAEIKYVNVPVSLDGDRYFSNSLSKWQDNNIYQNPVDRSISVYYEMPSVNYNYLVFPALGLYNFSEIKDKKATIDLSQMDKLVKAKLKTPAYFQKRLTVINGFPLANDFNHFVPLYYKNIPDSNNEIFYPNKYFHSYQFFTEGHKNNDYITYQYYSLSDSIPTNLSFIDESNLEVNNRSFDNLQVAFPKEQPSYYATTWSHGDISWRLYLPPHISSFNPKSLFNSLNSITLKDSNMPELLLTTVIFQKVDDYNMQTFFDVLFNANPNKEKKIKLSKSFERYIP